MSENPKHSHEAIVVARDKRCIYCGKVFVDDYGKAVVEALTEAAVSFIWPQNLHGASHPLNLIFSCFACNIKRGQSIPPFYKSWAVNLTKHGKEVT